jgi:hypothetical protein
MIVVAISVEKNSQTMKIVFTSKNCTHLIFFHCVPKCKAIPKHNISLTMNTKMELNFPILHSDRLEKV